jgi:hypothetical protein
MSDKQFAGYLWARSGSGDGMISRARLLAHCSSAVRPRADVKARAYNLVLELDGSQEAEDLQALLEDREGARALMRMTKGDPEDVTRERLPFILEQVKLAAGEYAANTVREESKQREAELRKSHDEDIERLLKEAAATKELAEAQTRVAQMEKLQHQQQHENAMVQNEALRSTLVTQANNENARKTNILRDGFTAGVFTYRLSRWASAIIFGIVAGKIALLSALEPEIAAAGTVVISIGGFWFVPDILDKPLNKMAMKRLKAVVVDKDASVEIPNETPDFRNGTWKSIN